jgi:hypothetical protein
MESNCEKNLDCNTFVRNNNSSVVTSCLHENGYGKMKSYTQTTTDNFMLLKIFFGAIFSICMSLPGFSQSDMDYAIHANIVYRFTKYINWPENKKNGDFIIGVIGDSPIFNELQYFLPNKKVGSQKIVVKRFSSTQSSFNCHILFISDEKSNSIKKIVACTKGTSESDGLADRGSCINFIVIEDHIKLEINKTNILERDLNIANELLSLAIQVK